jgi:hypothetical protein
MLLIPLLLAAVQPTVEPRDPAPHEAVVVRFVSDWSRAGTYRAEATPKGCAERESRRVNAPAKGRTVRLRIRAPRAGWCAGTYKATVWFKPEQHCPPTINCGSVAEKAIGSTRFTVSP